MIDLRLGDCLEVMQSIPADSVDMVLADLPYGTTACKWDTVIPLEPLWKEYKRLIKRNGAIVLTASQPFTSALVMSNPEWFKYCWVWDKNCAANFLAAKRMPLLSHEDICVFSPAGANNGARVLMVYNPQMVQRDIPRINDRRGWSQYGKNPKYHHLVGREQGITNHTHRYPQSVIRISNADHTSKVHPTQKPVALMEYLIRTYTNEGETVLDNTMGSGTTGVACVNTGRNFIGIEKDAEYYNVACKRINDAQNCRQLTMEGIA